MNRRAFIGLAAGAGVSQILRANAGPQIIVPGRLGVPIAFYSPRFQLINSTNRLSWVWVGVSSSETTGTGFAYVGEPGKWMVSIDSGSSSTTQSGGTLTGVSITVDGQTATSWQRSQMYSNICNGKEHLIVVAASSMLTTAVGRFSRYPDTPSYDLRSGRILDVKIDAGNTGSWTEHWPLSHYKDYRNLKGSGQISIVAD